MRGQCDTERKTFLIKALICQNVEQDAINVLKMVGISSVKEM